MSRYYYKNDIFGFLTDPASQILGELATHHEFA
jgi:hypothetical protein